MAGPPTGTVTFLFTDIEGSTKMWERSPEAMQVALARHDEILREAIEAHGGYVFKTVGDAFCAAFSTAPDALEAALSAQKALLGEAWEETGPLRVRMALHTGAAELRGDDYFGVPLNRVARLLSAGHGSQVLLSVATQQLVRDQLPAGTQLRDLGERRLKDLFRPEHIFQLMASDLPAEFPPLRTLDTRLNNLPAQPTPLIGREREVADVCERVRSSEVRLLTLTGSGGAGKTRVGLQAAAELLEEYEDGVLFVSLAAITDPTLVAATVAGTLGVKEADGEPLLEILKDYLREKKLLLILDNFEQVLEGAQLVGLLLAACPALKVLATSRIPLGLYGEKEYLVPPLSLPDPERLPSLECLTRYGAVRLFVERAQAAKADFTLTDENAPAVAEICARLDGLPLAIELAAVKIKLLPPGAMLARLGNRLKLLTGGARDIPERQRTLRNTIEWSHELLEEGERILFRRLAVFAGGRTLEAIETICDAEGDLPIEVLEGVSVLVDESLLRQEERGGEPRLYMLETIHEYAREKLEESGEAKELARRHAEYFLGLAEMAEPALRWSKQRAWLERLELEHDNLRKALSWSLGVDEVELGLRLAGALEPFWTTRGYYSEGRRWLEAVLAKNGRTSAVARAKALTGAGWLAQWQGDLDRASTAAEKGLRLSPPAGTEGSVTIRLLLLLGFIADQRDYYERATELFEESLKLSRETRNGWGIAASLLHLGDVASNQGEAERAVERYEEGIALCREAGYPALLADILVNLGDTLLLQGDHERATALNEEAVALYREQGYTNARLEYPVDNLGWAALRRGDHERARTLYQECLVLCRELGNKLVAAESLEGLACVAAVRGEVEQSARLFGAADALLKAQDISHRPAERALREPYLTAARSRSNKALWEAGSKMTFEEAIEYALAEDQFASSALSTPRPPSIEE
jgi:predicted ATPase/class 3 adenylate cyclase